MTVKEYLAKTKNMTKPNIEYGYNALRRHINRVQKNMSIAVQNLTDRLVSHDDSKYSAAERKLIENKHALDQSKYMSEEYRQLIKESQSAVDTHRTKNDHHPEYHQNGINDMSAMAIIEMLCDWQAAGQDSQDGSMEKSIVMNVERFNVAPQVESIMRNTAKELGFL